MSHIKIGERLLDLSTPKVMGILNYTSDSFFDGGKYNRPEAALSQVAKMRAEGADIIDLGAFSSKPGAKLLEPKEQIIRLEPLVQSIIATYPDVILSIDTYSSQVVRALARYTRFIVNDISGYSIDPDLPLALAETHLPYVLMHARGRPENMSELTQYEDVTGDIIKALSAKIRALRNMGIVDIIVDPGFGFAKTTDQNYQLLRQLAVFGIFDLPVMVGLSRKSMIYKVLEGRPETALNGTTALHMIALTNGANILRVHDVKEARETIKLWTRLTDVNE